jgi:hypothetical protein
VKGIKSNGAPELGQRVAAAPDFPERVRETGAQYPFGIAVVELAATEQPPEAGLGVGPAAIFGGDKGQRDLRLYQIRIQRQCAPRG